MQLFQTTFSKSILTVTAGLAFSAQASVIQTFSDQENIPNFAGGTELGTFSVTGTPDLFLSYTMNWNSGTEGSNKFVVIYFGTPGEGVNFGLKSNQGPNDGSGPADFIVRAGGSSPIAYAPDQVTIPSSVRIVGRIQDTNNNGDYDAAALWIDPAASDFGSPDATISGFAITVSPSPLGLRSVNLNDDDLDLVNIIVTDDFASAIPEPSSFGLLVFAGAALLLRRSRRLLA